MNRYLGEFTIDVSTHPEFKKYTPADWAMYFVENYGQIDGSHHKQWVLDQVARCLKGVPVIVVEARWVDGTKEYRVTTSKKEEDLKEYEAWVRRMRGDYDEEYEEYEYGYDEGVAP